jgi:hypothetical protein
MSFKIVYEDTDFIIISKLEYTIKEQLEILRDNINEIIQVMEDNEDDTMISSTFSQDSIEEIIEDAMKPNEYGVAKCQHCDSILTYGYDEDDMLHCQGCHNIWDGCAQCDCY